MAGKISLCSRLTMHSSSPSAQLVKRYFQQLTLGCGEYSIGVSFFFSIHWILLGSNQCLNVYCTSNSSFKYDRNIFKDPNKAAVEALRLATDYHSAYLDESINSNQFLMEENLQQIIQSEQWDLLRTVIHTVFSNRQNLSSSFLKKGAFPLNLSSNIDTSSSSASATPKSSFIHDPRITSKNEEITLDFPMMIRSMKLLVRCDDEISSTMANALGNLFKQILNELSSNKKGEVEEDAHFLNIFFIIFQLPYLSDPTFLYEHARSFYSLFSKFSLDLQVKFIRVLAKHNDELGTYVAHVQQYITMYTMKWCDHTQMNSMTESLLSQQTGRYPSKEKHHSLIFCRNV